MERERGGREREMCQSGREFWREREGERERDVSVWKRVITHISFP